MKKNIDFCFVTVKDASKEESRYNARIAKSHTAKVLNKRRNTAQTRRARDAASATPTKVNAVAPYSSRQQSKPSSSTTHISSRTAAQLAHPDLQCLLSCPKTLSPVTGGIMKTTFDWTCDLASVNMVEYLALDRLPTIRTEKGISWVIEGICTSPMVFHLYHWITALYHDIQERRAYWMETSAALKHRDLAISLVRQAIERVDGLTPREMEYLILVTGSLGRSGVIPGCPLTQVGQAPFRAHWPTEFGNVHSRTERIEMHARACILLIERGGGLSKLYDPDVAVIHGLHDVMTSAISQGQPIYPCYWDERKIAMGNIINEANEDVRSGAGFLQLRQVLPERATAGLHQLAIADYAMSNTLAVSHLSMAELKTLRNASCHRVLSLPRWHKLEKSERESSVETLYELCRLTARLYLGLVMLGCSPQSNWHHKVVASIRSVLERSERWHADSEPLRRAIATAELWATAIAGIAAAGSSHRAFFEAKLCTMMGEWGCADGMAARRDLTGFLWSDSACDEGAATLSAAVKFRGSEGSTA